MFRVLPVCRLVITVLWRIAAVAVSFFIGGVPALLFFAAGGIWLQLYLNKLVISISNDVLVKRTGNLFRRKTVLILKNAVRIQTLFVHPVLPGIIRLVFQNGSTYIIGLDGKQVLLIEKYVLERFKR